ncbi:hypothetical protein Goarm_011061, partial [Gossypium armourianum]|nr:hypothetical protein [Gossypium armourianum]
ERVREVEGKTSRKGKETVLDENESESFEDVGKEEDRNETEYFDSDDHGSIIGSEDDDNTDVCRRSRFPTYNPNSAIPHFCIGILFKDKHFEATIGDHLKIKLKEIQRRVASGMHVNVNITRCRRAKKMVKDKLAENFVHEFAKNPGSTIKMAVDRVTPESPPHFKRPILDLDGCFLKGLFKGELLAIVGKDRNNQIYLVAWAIVEGECIDSWA